MPESVVQQVLQAVQSHTWIQRVEHQIIGKVAKLRLFLAENRFVAIYYNAQTGSTSYAYIEGEDRLFGANLDRQSSCLLKIFFSDLDLACFDVQLKHIADQHLRPQQRII